METLIQSSDSPRAIRPSADRSEDVTRVKTRADEEQRARRLLEKMRSSGPGASAARDALVLQFHPLVQKQARQYQTSMVPLEDLVQEGFLGLMYSIKQFDPTRGVKLLTYATHHIDGHIRHYLRDRVQLIKEPAWLQENSYKVRRIIDTLTQELGRDPTDSEVAASGGLEETEVARVRTTRSIFAVQSLEETQEADNSAARLGESRASFTGDYSPVQVPIEDRLALQDALVRLKDIEQKVIYSFYYEDLSQTDIARNLGVSNNYISHILKNSARKLQQMFRNDAVREAALQHERRRQYAGVLGSDVTDWEDPLPTIVDSVTGLYTQPYFEARLEEEVSRAKRHHLELSLIRLQVGMDVPEAALFAQIAQTIKEGTRRSDLVARSNTREIAVLLPYTGTTREVVYQRLRTRLATLCATGMPHYCTILTGSASYPAHRQVHTLFAAAKPTERI